RAVVGAQLAEERGPGADRAAEAPDALFALELIEPAVVAREGEAVADALAREREQLERPVRVRRRGEAGQVHTAVGVAQAGAQKVTQAGCLDAKLELECARGGLAGSHEDPRHDLVEAEDHAPAPAARATSGRALYQARASPSPSSSARGRNPSSRLALS